VTGDPAGAIGRATRVGLDATPLLGPRTGVGQYTAGLVRALAAAPDGPELVLVPFTWRGAGGLTAGGGAGAQVPLGPRVRAGNRRVPARALQAAWARTELPPVEWLAGRVDLFHATNFVAPPARRAAVTVTVHDLTYLRFPELVSAAAARYRDLVPRSVARSAVVCTPTAAVAAEVAETYRLPADRIAVTPLGVDPSWLAASPPDPAWLAARGLPARYLLFVGSLEPRKNLRTLLAAYRELLAADGDAPPLVLAGPPGWGPALDASGIPPGRVVTTGYLDQADLVRVAAGAAAFAFPSIYEGFGLPPLEALACGVPVVAADLPALREVLGGHAAFVDPRAPDALAAALAKALADDGGPDARAARRAHAAGFTWAGCAAATLGAWRRALA
jgi:glycosyltransferase involved in cell wall biosynthesis